MHFGHFFGLFIEYCFFPFALFLLVIFFKQKKHSPIEKSNQIEILNGNGLEFVIIEAFTHLSVMVRIITDYFFDTSKLFLIPLFIISCVIVVVLFFLYFGYIHKNESQNLGSVKSLRVVYYTSFASWWIRIIILGFYIKFWEWDWYQLLCLAIVFSLSVFGIRNIIGKYFVTYNVLIKKMTHYNNNEAWKDAIKIGWIILEKFNGKQNETIYKARAETILEMGQAFYEIKDCSDIPTKSGKWLLREFINEVETSGKNKNMHKIVLIGLYCKCGDLDLAKELAKQVYKEEDLERAITMIDQGTSDFFVPRNI